MPNHGADLVVPAGRQARADFIKKNTRLQSTNLVPELQLHLADESLPIWEKTEEELGELNLPPPYWAFAWAGGQALARYILDGPELVTGKLVLDLGSGCGLVSIAAMKAGAAASLAADVDAFATIAAGVNAEANDVTFETTERDLLDGDVEGFDIVLVGDLFYEKPLSERVIAFMRRASAAGLPVLVGDPRRSYFPKDLFDCIAQYDVPVSRELEDNEIKRAAVWKLKK